MSIALNSIELFFITRDYKGFITRVYKGFITRDYSSASSSVGPRLL